MDNIRETFVAYNRLKDIQCEVSDYPWPLAIAVEMSGAFGLRAAVRRAISTAESDRRQWDVRILIVALNEERWTHRDIAEELDVSPSSISRWRNGRPCSTRHAIGLLCLAFFEACDKVRPYTKG